MRYMNAASREMSDEPVFKVKRRLQLTYSLIHRNNICILKPVHLSGTCKTKIPADCGSHTINRDINIKT